MLTRRQAQVLKFLREHLDADGEVSMTIRAVSAGIGLNNPTGAQNILNSLILKGYLKKLAPKYSCEPNVYQIIQRD